ncbi:MAG: hypothetical protein KFW09_04700 [Oscillospiraceae bacterium]|nr:hypothetical protein [Oscillospiraceae bacterium]
MKFKNFQLIIGDSIPKKSDIENICKIGKKIIKEYKYDWYEVNKQIIEDRFLWLYYEYDNAHSYNEDVLNGESDSKEPNPKTKTQVELRKQLFVCYDIDNNMLYTNKTDKKSFVKYYISDTLQKNVEIKNIYTTLDDFQNSVNLIKTLKFVQNRNLFNTNNDSIFNQQANIYGLDLPEKITVKVDYGNTLIDKYKNKLQDLNKKKKASEFQSITLIGVDDNNVEKSFDFSSMIESIELQISKDDNLRYNNEDVIRELLNRLR